MITTCILLLLHLTLRLIISKICLPLTLKVLPKLPITLTFLFGDPLILILILTLDHEDSRLASAQISLRNENRLFAYFMSIWDTARCWLLDFREECKTLTICSIELAPLPAQSIAITESEGKLYYHVLREHTTTTPTTPGYPPHCIPEFDFPSTHSESLRSFYSIRSFSTVVANDHLIALGSPSSEVLVMLPAPSMSTSAKNFKSTLSETTLSPPIDRNMTMTSSVGHSRVDEAMTPSTSKSSLSESLTTMKKMNTKTNYSRCKTKLRMPKKITVKSNSKPKITISRESYRKVVKVGTIANTRKDNTRYRDLVEKLRKFRIDSE